LRAEGYSKSAATIGKTEAGHPQLAVRNYNLISGANVTEGGKMRASCGRDLQR